MLAYKYSIKQKQRDIVLVLEQYKHTPENIPSAMKGTLIDIQVIRSTFLQMPGYIGKCHNDCLHLS